MNEQNSLELDVFCKDAKKKMPTLLKFVRSRAICGPYKNEFLCMVEFVSKEAEAIYVLKRFLQLQLPFIFNATLTQSMNSSLDE